MVIINNKYIKLLKKMITVYKNSNIDLTLIAYENLDIEGGLVGFRFFLAENIMPNKVTTYKLDWISGYKQSTINLFNVREVLSLFDKMKYDIKQTRMKQLYGYEIKQNLRGKYYVKDKNEDLKCDWSDEEIEDKALYKVGEQIAENIKVKLLNWIKEHNMDNKFYGYKENDIIMSTDKGFINLIDDENNILVQMIYESLLESDIVQCLSRKLLICEDINIPINEISSWIEKSYRINDKTLVKELKTTCNDEDKDCSMDIIKIYIMPQGKYEIDRQHMY